MQTTGQFQCKRVSSQCSYPTKAADLCGGSGVQVQQRYSHDLPQISKNYAKPTVYDAFSFEYLRYSTNGFVKLAAFLGNS